MSEKWMVKNPWFRRVFRDTYEEACRWMALDVQKALKKYKDDYVRLEQGEDEFVLHFKDFHLRWQVVQR